MTGVSSSIQFFIFGSNGVLFHPGLNRIWVLNPVAATVWCLLQEFTQVKDVHALVAKRFGINLEQAANDVADCMDYYKEQSLLPGGQPLREPETYNPLDIKFEKISWHEPDSWKYESYIHIPDMVVHFVSTDKTVGEQCIENLQHMRMRSVPTQADARIALTFDAKNNGWSIFLNERNYVYGIADNAVLPYLYFLFFYCATKSLDKYFLLHGAVLYKGGKTLILLGIAKSGKTTLTAILASQGWHYYSDELVVLDVVSGRVKPFPFPMSIKPGSMPVLEAYYQGLMHRTLWDRIDDQQVRYLLPPQNALPDSLDFMVQPSVLLFPEYSPKIAHSFKEIDKVDALQRLAATGSSNRSLRADDVAAMIQLVERCPAYSLVFGDVVKAVALIESTIENM